MPSWPRTAAPAASEPTGPRRVALRHGDISGLRRPVSPRYVSMLGAGVVVARAGGVWPAGVGGWGAAERRATWLVIAPIAHPARVGSEVTGACGPADRRPDRGKGMLEADQLRLIRRVAQSLPIGQIQQPQLARYHPADPQHC